MLVVRIDVLTCRLGPSGAYDSSLTGGEGCEVSAGEWAAYVSSECGEWYCGDAGVYEGGSCYAAWGVYGGGDDSGVVSSSLAVASAASDVGDDGSESSDVASVVASKVIDEW